MIVNTIYKPYTRRVSRTEKLWLAADQLNPSFANQIVIEGTGKLNYSEIENAVTKASEANPGSRLILKNRLGFSKWVDSGIPPRVREVHITDWSGFTPEGAWFLENSLPPTTGPTCEVIVLHGNPVRIVFRTNHSVMDGRGTMIWMEDIFRVLRGEILLGSNSTLTDRNLAKSFQNKVRKSFPKKHLSPTGQAVGREPGVVWQRIRVKGDCSDLFYKLIIHTASEAWQHTDGLVRIGVPVDLRFRKKKLRSTGNLSMMLYLKINKDSTSKSVSDDIIRQLVNKNDGILTKGGIFIDLSPLWLIKYIMKKSIVRQHTNGYYAFTGIISNLGKLPINKYKTTTFSPKTGFFVPPGLEYIPITITLSGGMENLIEILVSMPKSLANYGRLENFMDRFEYELTNKGINVDAK